MANFLVASANTRVAGTDTTDLFLLTTALGATVIGQGGADQISAAGVTTFTNAQIFGGGGADSVYLTAQPAGAAGAVASFFLGGGADQLVASGVTFTNSTVIGGGGSDTINIVSGTFTNGNINGNAENDLITASAVSFANTFIGGGAGLDTIVLQNILAGSTNTINGGGGNDSILVSAAAGNNSAWRIDGDTTTDTTNFGFDTVTVNGIFTAGLYNLAGGADKFVQNAAIGTGSTVDGGGGLDSIFINSIAAGAGVRLLGGAGIDTITVSGALAAGPSFGTINGGAGVDIINVSAAAVQGGQILGGAEGDFIGLGTISNGAWSTAPVAGVSGINVSYASFAESTITNTDVISALAADSTTTGGAAFMVTQSAVDFAVVANGTVGAVGNQFTIASGSRALGLTAGPTNLTQRASAIDAALSVGQSVLFQAGATNYLFVQGGAAGSGTANDLIVQLNVGGFAATSGGGVLVNGGLLASNNSALKVYFTNNTSF